MTPKTILLAEDNPINRELARTILHQDGYNVIEATDGGQAVEMARTARPDLILMDIKLPELDGLSATRLLEQDPATCSIPVIALTALALPGDREKLLAAGCVAYLTKPIDFTELRKTLAEIMRLSGDESETVLDHSARW